MTAEVRYYRLWCETEGAYKYVWSTEIPTQCPDDPAHTIDPDKTVAIEVVGVVEARTADNVMRASIEPAEGNRHTAITPNWCDKCTWYYKSTKQVGQTLVDQGDHIHYRSPSYPKVWIDNYHGRYSNEDFLLTEAGDVPRLKVYVDAVEKTEQDPHTGAGGDYTVDYENGEVVFEAALSGSEVVTVDVWESGDSCWTLKPLPGRKLKVTSSEVQFTKDVSIRDTISFQVYGLVEVFAPALTPVPYPAGTLIPLGDPILYKTMMDYISEADGSMPEVPVTTNPSPTWRDLSSPVLNYAWQYKALTELRSSDGMEIRVQLVHDDAFDGGIATASFYCTCYEETP